MTRSRSTAQQGASEGMLAPGVPRPVWKTSEVVAFAVARDIVEHGLTSGDRLPLEAEMVEQYRVSRESLREALRLLEAQGIVSIRRGPGGGPVVGTASSMNLARTMTLYFQLAGATYEELLEAWRMLEPLAAELAAKNPDRDLVADTLGAHLESFDDHGDVAAYQAHSNGLHFSVDRPRRQPGPGAGGRRDRRHHPHPRHLAHRPVRAAPTDRRRPRRRRRGASSPATPHGRATRCSPTSTAWPRSTARTGTATSTRSSSGSEGRSTEAVEEQRGARR